MVLLHKSYRKQLKGWHKKADRIKELKEKQIKVERKYSLEGKKEKTLLGEVQNKNLEV